MRRISCVIIALSVCQLCLFANEQMPETEYKTITDVSYLLSETADEYAAERCKLDIYYPTNLKDFSTVIWFHGGGLRMGQKSIPDELKDKGFAVIAVNYRLYPKVKCPVYVEDAAQSVAWVFKNISNYGGDPDKIFVSGHSAGGYLTLMVSMDKKYLAKYDIDANKIAGIAAMAGHTITHVTVRKEHGIEGTQPIIDEMAPLSYIRSDMPRLMLVTGDRELEVLGRYEENAYLMRMMKVVGHKQTKLYELQGYGHEFRPTLPLLVKFINGEL